MGRWMISSAEAGVAWVGVAWVGVAWALVVTAFTHRRDRLTMTSTGKQSPSIPAAMEICAAKTSVMSANAAVQANQPAMV
jgi:hypothetical protein